MTMKLYTHPFSSYCQKVLIALYENDTPFEFRMLTPEDEQTAAKLEALWPLKRFPVLVDEGRTVIEASIIIEHLGLHHPGPIGLISEDRTRLGPSLLGIVAAFASFFLLALALRGLPIGLAYAVWTGIGCVGIALVGIIVFGESAARLALRGLVSAV